MSGPPCTERAQLISIARGCQRLRRGTAKVTALLRILMGREKSAGRYSGESQRFESLLLAGVVLKVSTSLLSLNHADKQHTSESWRRTAED